MLSECPGGCRGGIGDEGVGPHGEAPDRLRVRDVLADDVIKDQAGKTATLGVQGGGAAVDVVIRFLAAGECEVSEAEGVRGNQIQKGVTVGAMHWQKDKWKSADHASDIL